MKRLSDDDYDPPVLGADPDRQSEPDPRRGTLTTQASELFVSAWKQMLADHPSVAMKVAAQPWLSGQKQWYMAWLKRQFLPAIDGDLERAEKIFSMFCRHLVEGSEFVPQNTSPFQRLHVRSDKYARLVPSAALPTVEEFRETGTSLRNNVVMGERPGRQNRRPRKPSQLPGVDLGDFLD
jgi:hypothetical protein